MDLNLTAAPTQLSALAALVWTWAATFLPRVAAAALIIAAGFVLAGWVSRLVHRLVQRSSHIDSTVEPILGTAARYAVLILFLVAALGQLGVQTASLLAVLGAAGLAIGLALQGTLQNIAAGIMLIYLRPFRAGDLIETPTISGRVREIGLFVAHLETPDGLFYFVPNSALWNVPLKNHTRNGKRLMTVQIGVGYDADLAEAGRVLLAMAEADPRVLKHPPPSVAVEAYGETRVSLALRAWAPNDAYWAAQHALMQGAKERLQASGIKVPN